MFVWHIKKDKVAYKGSAERVRKRLRTQAEPKHEKTHNYRIQMLEDDVVEGAERYGKRGK